MSRPTVAGSFTNAAVPPKRIPRAPPTIRPRSG